MFRALSSDLEMFEDYVKRKIGEIEWSLAERTAGEDNQSLDPSLRHRNPDVKDSLDWYK